MSKLYYDYPNEPIGGGNPYYRCQYCGISDPEINGRLEGHGDYCDWRIKKELELEVEKLKSEKETTELFCVVYWDGSDTKVAGCFTDETKATDLLEKLEKMNDYDYSMNKAPLIK